MPGQPLELSPRPLTLAVGALTTELIRSLTGPYEFFHAKVGGVIGRGKICTVTIARFS